MSKYKYSVIYSTVAPDKSRRYVRNTHAYDTPEKAVQEFEIQNNNLINKNKMLTILVFDEQDGIEGCSE